MLPYDSLAELRYRLTEVAPNLTRYGNVEQANFFAQGASLNEVKFSFILGFFCLLIFFAELISIVLFSGIFCSFYSSIVRFCFFIYLW